MTKPHLPYKITLLAHNEYLPAWQHLMLEQLIDKKIFVFNKEDHNSPAASLAEITCVLMVRKTKINTWPSRFEKALRKILLRLDSHLFKAPALAQKTKSIMPLLGNTPFYDIQQLKPSESQDLFKTDLVIDLIGLDRESLQQLSQCWPKLGVWRYFYSKDHTLNEQHIAINEYLQKDQELVAGLERIPSRHSPKAQCLFYATTSTHTVSLMRSIEAHLWKMADFIPERLQERQQAGEQIFSQRAQERYDAHYQTILKKAKQSHRSSSLLLYSHYPKNFLKKAFIKLTRSEQWILLAGHITNPLQLDIDKIPYQLIPPKDRLWADPFVVQHQGKNYVFFEELLYSRGIGHLSYIRLNKDGSHSESTKILERPYHLSFPFIFQYQNHYYMIPETAENKAIELYRCKQFPNHWVFEKNLMEGIRAYDTSLFFHKNTWWLLASVSQHEKCLPNEALHLFYADSPLSQNWQAHPENPVVSEASLARPAGTVFEQESYLYRPSQNCAGSYGKSLNINQITQLNKRHYQEKKVHSIQPDPAKHLDGIHTLNFNEELIVMDAIYTTK